MCVDGETLFARENKRDLLCVRVYVFVYARIDNEVNENMCLFDNKVNMGI